LSRECNSDIISQIFSLVFIKRGSNMANTQRQEENCTGGNDTTSHRKAAESYQADDNQPPLTAVTGPKMSDEDMMAEHRAKSIQARGGDAGI